MSFLCDFVSFSIRLHLFDIKELTLNEQVHSIRGKVHANTGLPASWKMNFVLLFGVVKKNDNVREGQLIGKVGDTGVSKGPHLHYEILKDNIAVNPRTYIRP